MKIIVYTVTEILYAELQKENLWQIHGLHGKVLLCKLGLMVKQ